MARIVALVDTTGKRAVVTTAVAAAAVAASLSIAATATGAASAAPCTKKALRPALRAAADAPVTIQSFACKNGWASGAQTVGRGADAFDAAFLARDKNGRWVVPKKLPCNNPSIPKVILKNSPCEVS